MTDQNLAVVANPYLEIAIANAANDAPVIPKSATPSIPKLALVQKTSEKYIEHGKVGQWVIDYNDGITPFKFFDKLNVWLFGIYEARVFFARKEDGSRTSTNTPPSCQSGDGKHPFDTYVGEQIVDFRTGKTVTITGSCEGCPFSEWHNYRDANGNYVLENGKKKGDRPCTYTPRYALWVDEIGFLALFKPTASNVRKYMEGRKRPVVIAGIDKYFIPNGKVELQNGIVLESTPTKPDGVSPHFVTMKTKKLALDDGSSVYVPELSVNPDVIPYESFMLKKEHQESWEKFRQEALARAEQYDSEEMDDEGYAPVTPLSEDEVRTAADILGSNAKNKKRRIAVDEETVETFEED